MFQAFYLPLSYTLKYARADESLLATYVIKALGYRRQLPN